MQPYVQRSDEELEAGVQLFYDPPIMFPIRPAWDRSLTPAQLENQEQRYFQVSFSNKLILINSTISGAMQDLG